MYVRGVDGRMTLDNGTPHDGGHGIGIGLPLISDPAARSLWRPSSELRHAMRGHRRSPRIRVRAEMKVG
jgi:hypothetical protein